MKFLYFIRNLMKSLFFYIAWILANVQITMPIRLETGYKCVFAKYFKFTSVLFAMMGVISDLEV